MEHKGSYILLTGLLIITLLVTVVGTTFSYFGVTKGDSQGETTIQVTDGTLIFKCDSDINAGTVNAGESLTVKTFTVTGSTTGSNNLGYELDLNVKTNTYADNTVYYTVTSTNTSSNGVTIQTTSVPVAIPTGESIIKVGTGSFAGPVENGTHTYTINIYRSNESYIANGEQSSFVASLDLIKA